MIIDDTFEIFSFPNTKCFCIECTKINERKNKIKLSLIYINDDYNILLEKINLLDKQIMYEKINKCLIFNNISNNIQALAKGYKLKNKKLNIQKIQQDNNVNIYKTFKDKSFDISELANYMEEHNIKELTFL